MGKTPRYNTVTVQVPATTANLGPGFDCLGMALSQWNRVRIQRRGPPDVAIHGEGEGHLRRDKHNLIYRAAQRLFQEAEAPDAELQITAWQEVPLSRGLGSSACAIVAGLVGANALLDYPLGSPRILELAVEMEGHPDNVAAALMGGCCIALTDGERVHAAQVPVPDDLQCVVFIPEQPMTTRSARAVLPYEVSRQDAVFNIGRTALLIAGLATGHTEYLAWATQDRLHQTARQQVFPAMKHLFDNALKAGALGVFLSGAGSSVVALTRKSEHRAMTIGLEMADAADKARLPGSFVVLEPTSTGAEVLALGAEV
jgi:homoserine kinase